VHSRHMENALIKTEGGSVALVAFGLWLAGLL
jgi:hypothetical protein